MDIEKYKKMDLVDAVTYDFVRDTIENEKFDNKYNAKDGVERYILYCASECKFNPIEDKELVNELFDPDNESDLLQKIYKELYGFQDKKAYMKKGNIICSDTMTSLTQRVNDYYSNHKAEEIKISNKNITINDFRLNLGNKQKFSKRFTLELYSKIEKDDYKNLVSTLIPFFSIYHTIGNYCPVPVGFNVARSGSNARHDYWDITLMKIYEYYDNPQEGWRILGEELLHGRGNSLACKVWLDDYGSWVNFINQNYFQDYVDKDNKVIPFWNNHSWKEPSLIKDKEKIFVEKVSYRIIKRGIRMVSALNNLKMEEKKIACKATEIKNNLFQMT